MQPLNNTVVQNWQFHEIVILLFVISYINISSCLSSDRMGWDLRMSHTFQRFMLEAVVLQIAKSNCITEIPSSFILP